MLEGGSPVSDNPGSGVVVGGDVIGGVSFTEYLAGLDASALTTVLGHRPDVLVEPVPRSVDELALRLNGSESLTRILPMIDRDQHAVAQAVALLGTAPVAVVAGRLRSPEREVRWVVGELCARGLAWEVDGRLGLPPRLTEHLEPRLAGIRPLTLIATQARVDELRVAVAGLGSDPAGLRKPELIERLGELLTDRGTVARAVGGLSPAARRQLAVLCDPEPYYVHYGGDVGTAALVRSGLLVGGGGYGRAELPREVAALLLFGEGEPLAGRPVLPPATDPPGDGRAGVEAALLALTTVLDEAAAAPLSRLKKGGVGTRERARLATRLAVPDPALWIDLAHAAGLLAEVPDGYAAAAGYDGWREQDPDIRWSRVALAWWELLVAPTSRETDDGEVPPPLPLDSGAGVVRRALLAAAAGGLSLRAAGEQLDWFAPLQPYDGLGRDRKVAAALHEAALLGVVAGDRLSTLGELLVEVSGAPDAVDLLARRSADLLPAARGLLVLQSDLTAVVSGQPSAAAARLLAAAATSEGRGVAATWRFSPVSVRAAFDAGWTPDELRAGLAAISDHPLPQSLDYLITDVARRHGSVRLRGSRSVVVGAEPEIAEILHTRSLQSLHLSRLAPTVLSSPFELDAVLVKLRGAGFSPMPEDAEGVVIVAERAAGPAPAARAPRARARVAAADLAARLRVAGPGGTPSSPTCDELAPLAPRLDAAEVALLAHALDHRGDVRITYRNKDGNRTVRDIRPEELYGRWISAWCHLRAGEREFSVAGIEAVAPVG